MLYQKLSHREIQEGSGCDTFVVYIKSSDIGVKVANVNIWTSLYVDDKVLVAGNPNDLQKLPNALEMCTDKNKMCINQD